MQVTWLNDSLTRTVSFSVTLISNKGLIKKIQIEPLCRLSYDTSIAGKVNLITIFGAPEWFVMLAK